MRAYGSDRVRQGDGGARIIVSRRAKGWTARVPRTMTSAEFPGTAVLWDDAYFEVVSEEPQANGGWRYVLEPWRDSHAMRVADAYDEASEGKREAEYRAAILREKGRKTANFFGVFTGHLPAIVQHQLASEIGILPARLTLLSLVLPMLFIILTLHRVVNSVLQREALPIVMIVIAIYLALETVIRFNIVWMQSRPIGSTIGLIVYSCAWLVGLRKAGAIAPTAAERGTALFTLPPSEDVAARDSIATRSPFMTLLSPAEQRLLAERYGFDYRADAPIVAGILLVCSVLGVVSSFAKLSDAATVSAMTSLGAALALAIEQIYRLVAFKRGPAGSMLGVIVRPFMRRFLSTSSRA